MSGYYPPGVTGNESQITGEWSAECADCGAAHSDKTEMDCLAFDDEVVCVGCMIERIKEAFQYIGLDDLEDLLKEHNEKGKQK